MTRGTSLATRHSRPVAAFAIVAAACPVSYAIGPSTQPSTPAAEAQDAGAQGTGDWSIHTSTNRIGQACDMTTPTWGGSLTDERIAGSPGIWVRADKPTWNLNDGPELQPVTFAIDGNAPWTGPAAAGNSTLLMHMVGPDADSFRSALTHGTELDLQTNVPGESVWTIALLGARVALADVDQCASRFPE